MLEIPILVGLLSAWKKLNEVIEETVKHRGTVKVGEIADEVKLDIKKKKKKKKE